MLNVIEMSRVIQGEGRYTGVPSLLIRMTNCNLRCPWCDSKEASWNAKKGKYTLEDVKAFLDNDIKHIFITGGNPTDPRNVADLKLIIAACKVYGKFVYIEDNGTNFVSGLDLNFVSLSPKLSSSIPYGTKHEYAHTEQLSTLTDNLEKWNDAYNCQFKFVITNELDLAEAMGLVEALQLEKSRVYLMPEGTTDEELNRNRKMVLEACIRLNVRYTDRLHIVVYGNKKFVWWLCDSI